MFEIYMYRNLFVPLNMVSWPILLVILFFSVVIHEVAHGYTALKNGDPTALHMGRLTLNPVPHIDPIGTILVPVILVILPTRFVFGWAKPVPINPYNFQDIRKGTIQVSLSGAFSNFTLAVLFSLLVRILQIAGVSSPSLLAPLAAGSSINIILGLFNLVPVPPLDGSKVLSSLLPYETAQKYESIAPYGFFLIFIFLGLIWQIIGGIGNIIYQILMLGLPM